MCRRLQSMVRIKLLLIFLLAGSATVSVAQVNRYMVFFKDKQGTGHSVDNPQTFLNARSIQRRTTQGIDITAEDLPVTNAYVQGVRETGATVLYKTKWMNGVLAICTPAQLAEINALAFVVETELVAPDGLPGARRKRTNKLRLADTNGDKTIQQLTMLGMDEMHQEGYYGEGVIIAIMDGGFLGVNSAAPFQDIINNRFNAAVSWDFTANTSNIFQYSEHGTSVLSVIGVEANVGPDQFRGGAYQASFQLFVTEDVETEYRIEEYNWLFAAERADSAGVDIINTSLGYNTFDDGDMDYAKADMDGNTAVITRAAQTAASKGIFLVNSAGNSGTDLSWQIITAPADGRDVLAVGNVNLQGDRSATSSIGPTADQRIKPDVVALGTGVTVIRANGAIGSANGTSFSSPLTAGLIAGLRQKYPNRSTADLLAAVRLSASKASSPDNFLGYGIPHYRAVVNYLEVTSVEPDPNQNLLIHPNPVRDTFTISPKKPSQLQVTNVALANARGQIVTVDNIVYDWPENTYSMSIGHLIPGVYFLTVRIGKKYETYKLVKI